MTNHTGTGCPATPLCKNTAAGVQAEAEAGSTALTKFAAAVGEMAAEGFWCNRRARKRTSPVRRAES